MYVTEIVWPTKSDIFISSPFETRLAEWVTLVLGGTGLQFDVELQRTSIWACHRTKKIRLYLKLTHRKGY